MSKNGDLKSRWSSTVFCGLENVADELRRLNDKELLKMTSRNLMTNVDTRINALTKWDDQNLWTFPSYDQEH